MASVDIL
nr:unnamed protein product [Macaca fascicularis]